MKKEAVMVLTDNIRKVIYIQSSKKEIGEHMIAIGDNDQFARFCSVTGLSWLFRYFPSMNKLGQCLGDFITKGSNPYLDAAISSHGLRVIPIGDHSYMLALSCDFAPNSLKDGLFCPTRPNFSEIYCGSALIFSVEKYDGDHYTQANCPLSIDTISELYSFDCYEKSSSSYLVASVEESGSNNSIMKTYRVTNIEWDTDGLEIDLPTDFSISVDVEKNMTEDEIGERISDSISDVYGFCHFGFNYYLLGKEDWGSLLTEEDRQFLKDFRIKSNKKK